MSCSAFLDLRAYLKLYMVTTDSDFQLLSSILILLRPSRIVFLHNLTIFDDAFDLGDQECADRHCATTSELVPNRKQGHHTLFANKRIVAIVGVVGISCHCASSVANDPKVELCCRH